VYKGDSIYSVLDADKTMLKSAVYDLNGNSSRIIDAHSLGGVVNTNAVQERACGLVPGGTAPTAFLASPQNQCTTNGCHRTKEAWHTIYDESYLIGGSFQQPVIVFNRSLYSQHARKTAFGWTVCQAAKWTFTANYNLTHNIPSTFSPPANPMTSSIGWTTEPECRWNYDSELIFIPMLGPYELVVETFNNRKVTGTLDFTTTPDGCFLRTSVSCP
jgi:hypothetical protein